MNLKEDLRLAVQALKVVLKDEDYCYSEEITLKINQEVNELQVRMQKKSTR